MNPIPRSPAGTGAVPAGGGFDTAVRRALDRSISGLQSAGAASEQRGRQALAAAAASAEQLLLDGARRSTLRHALRPQITRYAQLAERADAILHACIFKASEQLLGFVWDLFNGPVLDQAQAAVSEMSAAERAVFVALHEVLRQTDTLAGEEGLQLLLRSYPDRYLTAGDEPSDALVGVLVGLGRA